MKKYDYRWLGLLVVGVLMVGCGSSGVTNPTTTTVAPTTTAAATTTTAAATTTTAAATTTTTTTTTTASTTITSTTSTTTTTLAPGTISGTVRWTWADPVNDFGTLYVMGYDNADFSGGPIAATTAIHLATGEGNSYNYTLTEVSSGTYYLLGYLRLNRFVDEPDAPVSGDLCGEWDDGGLPASFGKTPVGVARAFAYSGAGVGGVNFTMEVTW